MCGSLLLRPGVLLPMRSKHPQNLLILRTSGDCEESPRRPVLSAPRAFASWGLNQVFYAHDGTKENSSLATDGKQPGAWRGPQSEGGRLHLCRAWEGSTPEAAKPRGVQGGGLARGAGRDPRRRLLSARPTSKLLQTAERQGGAAAGDRALEGRATPQPRAAPSRGGLGSFTVCRQDGAAALSHAFARS